MTTPAILESLLPTLGITAPVAWFLWQRFQSLEQRLDSIEDNQKQANHRLDLLKQKHDIVASHASAEVSRLEAEILRHFGTDKRP